MESLYFNLISLSNTLYYSLFPNPDRTEDVAPQLPHELIVTIFSRLNFKQIGRLCTVSKPWNTAANDPHLLKNVIYYKKTFNPIAWNKWFGVGCVPIEESELAYNSLSNDIGKTYKSKCKISRHSSFRCKRAILWFPKTIFGKTLTLENFIELCNKKFPAIIKIGSSTHNTIKNLKQTDIDHSGWMAMCTDIIMQSGQSKSYEQMQDAVLKLEMTVPSALQTLVYMNAVGKLSMRSCCGYHTQDFYKDLRLILSIYNGKIYLESGTFIRENDAVLGIEKL